MFFCTISTLNYGTLFPPLNKNMKRQLQIYVSQFWLCETCNCKTTFLQLLVYILQFWRYFSEVEVYITQFWEKFQNYEFI